MSRYQSVKKSESLSYTTSATPKHNGKRVMTFDELQSSLKTKNSTSSRKTPLRNHTNSPTTTASPLAQRIRQQILKTQEEAAATPTTTTKEPPMSSRKKRLERNQHLLVSKQKSPMYLTPTSARTSSTSFFTPRAATTPPLPRSTTKKGGELKAKSQSKSLSLVHSKAKKPSSFTFHGRSSSITPKSQSANTKSSAVKTTVADRTTPKPLARTKPKGPVSSLNKSTQTTKSASNLTPPLASNRKITSKKQLTPIQTSSLKTTPVSQDKDDTLDTRRNLDKRTARLRYSSEFAEEIAKYQATKSAGKTPSPRTDKNVSIFVRKRPMFDQELEQGDFDVVSVADSSDTVTVYRTKMEADMKTKTIQPVAFACTAAFDENATNEQVYHQVGQPLVETAKQGGIATLLMFGQTGSGKTYTMTAMEERVVHDLFANNGQTFVQVQFLELCGKVSRDLITNAAAGNDVRIMDKEDGSVHFVNAASVSVDSPQELYNVIASAKQRRATESTDRNNVSSRSHAVCQLTIRNGVLTLVDCAGTERRNDSMYHSKSRQAESAEINASLYALKECIRARQRKDARVPYRSSNLTRVLRQSLETKDAKLAVVATIAPNATDFEHTFQTLETVSSLLGGLSEAGASQKVTPKKMEERLTAPKSWSHDELVKWLSEKRLLGKSVPKNLDGRQVMRMSKLQLRNAFYEDSEMQKADMLFQRLRAESDRVARLELKRRMSLSTTHRSSP